jgi:hypothetical protein
MPLNGRGLLDRRITMKARESGMPDESYWESFFNPT